MDAPNIEITAAEAGAAIFAICAVFQLMPDPLHAETLRGLRDKLIAATKAPAGNRR
jgi:hypothetical protein